MLASIAQTLVQDLQIGHSPVNLPSVANRFQANVQVHQDIRPADSTPHIRHIRMFLAALMGIIAPGFESVSQRRFTRRTGPYQSDAHAFPAMKPPMGIRGRRLPASAWNRDNR